MERGEGNKWCFSLPKPKAEREIKKQNNLITIQNNVIVAATNYYYYYHHYHCYCATTRHHLLVDGCERSVRIPGYPESFLFIYVVHMVFLPSRKQRNNSTHFVISYIKKHTTLFSSRLKLAEK